MIFTNAVAAGIADGTVTVAFRRWARARVEAGTTIVSSAGVVRIDDIEQIDVQSISVADANSAGASSVAELLSTFRGSDDAAVYRITVSYVGADPRHELSADAELEEDVVEEIARKLGRMDARAESPWTAHYLGLVANRPAVRATDLAADVGIDTTTFKMRIRRLRNLGLTHSLGTGYRISPRGEAYLSLADTEGGRS